MIISYNNRFFFSESSWEANICTSSAFSFVFFLLQYEDVGSVRGKLNGSWGLGIRVLLSNNLKRQTAIEAATTNPPCCKRIKIINRPLVNSPLFCLGPQTVSCLEGKVSMQSSKPTHTVFGQSEVEKLSANDLPLQVGDVWKNAHKWKQPMTDLQCSNAEV